MKHLKPLTLEMLKSLYCCYHREIAGKPSHLFNTKSCLRLIKRGMLEVRPYSNGGFLKHTLHITWAGREAIKPLIKQVCTQQELN